MKQVLMWGAAVLLSFGGCGAGQCPFDIAEKTADYVECCAGGSPLPTRTKAVTTEGKNVPCGATRNCAELVGAGSVCGCYRMPEMMSVEHIGSRYCSSVQ